MSAVVDELAEVKLFGGLSQRQLRQLARLMKERTFRPGVTVVEEGTMSGVGFFIVAEGEASVSVDGREVARIGPGDHFGELALLDDEAGRTATVVANGELTTAAMTSWQFKPFLAEHPEMAWDLMRTMVKRLNASEQRNFAEAS